MMNGTSAAAKAIIKVADGTNGDGSPLYRNVTVNRLAGECDADELADAFEMAADALLDGTVSGVEIVTSRKFAPAAV
jgi:hypothetical protein